MCVAVVLNQDTGLTEEEVYKMGMANADGFGLAWAEDGLVHWWKTLSYDVEYLTYIINTLKDFPRFVHFRLSTAGGVRAELCHPFEIGPNAGCATRGHAHKVMMHNGHWSRADEIFGILKREQALPDNGPWSDTRLAALLAARDEDWLTTVTGKVATLDGNGDIKLIGYGWEDLRPGIKVSNKSWNHNYSYKRTGADRHWKGWGREEQEWEEEAKHEAEKKKQKEEEEMKRHEKEQEEKAKERAVGEGGQDSGPGKNVALRQSNRLLPAGGGDVPGSQGKGSIVQEGAKSGGEAKEAGKEGEGDAEKRNVLRVLWGGRSYSLEPWQNPTTKEWWQVDASRIKETDKNGNAPLRRLTPEEATRALGEIAVALGKTKHS